jgi:hypothetical protein
VPGYHVNAAIGASIVLLRDRLLRIPQELADQLAECNVPAACADMVDQRVRQALYEAGSLEYKG